MEHIYCESLVVISKYYLFLIFYYRFTSNLKNGLFLIFYNVLILSYYGFSLMTLSCFHHKLHYEKLKCLPKAYVKDVFFIVLSVLVFKPKWNHAV